MYLKALEIQGFKSFPDKTVLSFEEAVTAVVGPNGSGKSNISDAITWVLGEQNSRTLRGAKMEDVIFGGTEKRSQMGFAEVSIILDNSDKTLSIDQDEVRITRKYYRSGESEYYINKNAVRLKDINELFMDTGLGKEGYSIIGQGRIDEILSTKSEDRRKIFEEAAGISRFRHRKEESERKLQHTDDNLVRINDKISELELQVGPLKQQSEIAKQYLLLRDQLKEVEVSVWLENLERMADQRDKISNDYTTSKMDLEKANEELTEFYSNSEKFTEKMHEKDLELERVRDSISNSEAQNADYQSELAVLKTELAHNEESIAALSDEISNQQDREGNILSQITEKKQRLDEIEKEIQEGSLSAGKVIEEAEQMLKQSDENNIGIEKVIKEENDIAEKISATKVQISGLESSKTELISRQGTVDSEIQSAEEKLQEIKNNNTTIEKDYNEASDQIVSLKNVIEGYNIRYSSRKKKVEELAARQTKLTIDIGNIKSKITMLAEMEKEFEGYSKSVKSVMREKSRGTLKGIHGPVADLISVNSKYALAIEIALSSSAQNIIVDTEENGKSAINYLKRTDSGRATFLPLSSIKGSTINERGLDGEVGFEGIASELIKYDSKYENIYTYLLGRTVIVEEMDDAIRISRKYGSKFKCVTLDGQIINAGGSMTGGSTSKNTGILSRANELQKLNESLKSLEEEMNDVSSAYNEAKREYEKVNYEIETATGELRTYEDSFLKLQNDREHSSLLLEAAIENVEALKDEKMGLGGRIKKCTSDSDSFTEELHKLEKDLAKLKAENEQLVSGREELMKAREELLGKLADYRAKEASLETEKTATLSAIEELNELKNSLAGDSIQRTDKIEELKSKNSLIEEQIKDKNSSIAEVDALIETYRNKVSEIAEDKMKLETERTQKDKNIQEKNNQILSLERECARLEQKKLAAEMEESQINDKLWDNYELTRTSAERIRIEIESIPKANKKIGELKKDINALGTPNLGAIEEYERVSARYDYLTEQRNDITEAKDELLRIINDITKEMKDIFATEFEVINNSFKETFLELFGGGKAALELEDENDILNCGIEIKVQPPGKTLKTITLLSGGEKAFVAIALYFAILKVRPTPFCIMDEIEAALDEANVTRYSDYLRRMSNKTQFIVITHRRGTMEGADTLYGVTMQEKGISKIITVGLRDAAKNAR